MEHSSSLSPEAPTRYRMVENALVVVEQLQVEFAECFGKDVGTFAVLTGLLLLGAGAWAAEAFGTVLCCAAAAGLRHGNEAPDY